MMPSTPIRLSLLTVIPAKAGSIGLVETTNGTGSRCPAEKPQVIARKAPINASVCSGRPTEMRMQPSSPGLS